MARPAQLREEFNSSMALCSYHGAEVAEDQLTDEHVLPQALGGNLTPENPFKLRTVCRRCNGAAGRHIDGRFVRSWFTNNHRASNAHRYSDVCRNPVLPLIYFGPLRDQPVPGLVCEAWLGPSGGSIFHFHEEYRETNVTVGEPLHIPAEQVDAGYVIFFLPDRDDVWIGAEIFSVKSHFSRARVYLGNGSAPGVLDELPETLFGVRDQLRETIREMVGCQSVIDMTAGTRLLGKMALGFGCLFLDPAFQTSPDATLLRNFMWERDDERRDALGLRGASTWQLRDAEFVKFLKWDAGHVLFLRPVADCLALTTIFYGEQAGMLQVSTDPAHWRERIPAEGCLWVIAPALRRFVGPVSFGEYLSFRLNQAGCTGPLGELFTLVESLPAPPPFKT